MSMSRPECYGCRHLFPRGSIEQPLSCAAFPGGIPRPILYGHDEQAAHTDAGRPVSHRTPYPGDQGFQFEPRRRDQPTAAA